MVFSEPRFLLFFLLVFGVHWTLRSNEWRKHLLLVASLYFYGSWDWRFLGLIVGAATVDWYASLQIQRAREEARRAKGWLLFSLIYNLGVLGFFKYFNFFVDSGVVFLGWLGFKADIEVLRIVLPVGISFFTFQTMSYTIDVYRGHLQPVRGYLDFLLYVTFFPQLVAGPIVRASTFLPQLFATRRFADVDVHRALGQFLSGFIKKSVVADLIAKPADAVFADPSQYTAGSIWIAVTCYAIQIYCDFSGYSDMAIGSARLLGYELCENFRFPYLATSITDFWRRWHLSLSSWLRDYLYISLGGNRGGRWFTHRNLMLTMLLGGLWHGAGWNFVIWGAIHGVALVVHKEWVRTVGEGRLPFVSRLLTVYTVLLAWIFFRASNFEQAWTMAKAWLWWESPGTKEVFVWTPVREWETWLRFTVLVAPLLVLHVLSSLKVHYAVQRLLPAVVVTFLFGVVAAIALAFVPLEARPFIYFQF
ncbi:MAG: MBOAT family O-acyltransferase [Planctomycetota bacterium]|jgi:alginate O-acetyltransferase complex protein AlgI